MCEIGNRCHTCDKAENCLLLDSSGFEVPWVRAKRQREKGLDKADRPLEQKLIKLEDATRCRN